MSSGDVDVSLVYISFGSKMVECVTIVVMLRKIKYNKPLYHNFLSDTTNELYSQFDCQFTFTALYM